MRDSNRAFIVSGNLGCTLRESGSPRTYMKTIWKYEIKKLGFTCLELPKGAVARSCDIDMEGNACVWFEVDSTQPTESHFILAEGTGMSIDPSLTLSYIGMINDDGYMWHIYEVLNDK